MIEKGEREAAAVRKEILRVLESSPGIRVDYVELVDGLTLEEMPVLEGKVLLAAAVFVGKTRLIDNIDLEV
jgi:pantoate--beta-alanine ligase